MLKREIESRGGMSMKWVSPGTSGVPDRIVLLPGNIIYFVELKSPKYKRAGLSELQKVFHDKLKGLGMVVWTLRTTDQLFEFLKTIDHDTSKGSRR